MEFNVVCAQINKIELARWIQEYIRGSDNPDLRIYGQKVLRGADSALAGGDGFDRYYWFQQYIRKLAGMEKARVLEVGCGFGWDAVSFALLGDNRVIANDVRETMTGPVSERVAAINENGAGVDIEVMLGDICSLNLENGAFDVIYSTEAIEHVHDLEAMFRKCYEMLRPGGRLVVVNNAAALSGRALRSHRRMWEDRDWSWEYIERLKTERPIENRDAEPYGVMRMRIAESANPSLSQEEVESIARATAGLTEPEVAEYSKNYSAGCVLPTPPKYSPCRNPLTGEYCERLINPFEVVEMIGSAGMRTELHHAFRKWPLSMCNRAKSGWLHKVLFRLREKFVVVATKGGEAGGSSQ